MSTKKVLSPLLAFAIALSCNGWVPTRAEQTPAEKAETIIIATSLEMSLCTQNSIHCGGCLSQNAL